jgi:hypothetical protein
MDPDSQQRKNEYKNPAILFLPLSGSNSSRSTLLKNSMQKILSSTCTRLKIYVVKNSKNSKPYIKKFCTIILERQNCRQLGDYGGILPR